MCWPCRKQRKTFAPHRYTSLSCKCDIGWNNSRATVYPRVKRTATLLEPLRRPLIRREFILLVLGRALLRNYGCSSVILKRLQTVNVIGVIVTDYNVTDRPVS